MAKLGLVQLGMVENGGATRAKRLADIYIKTHSNAEGKVKDPAVYQAAIDQYLSPFADDLTVQAKMAGYQNIIKDLSIENSESNSSVEDLKLREHQAWYVGEDEADGQGFRNPEFVAQVTSESLDMLLAETISAIEERRATGKDTTDHEVYLRDLIKRSDRMRNLAQSLEDGTAQSLDGYGYYIDADPNTGAARGASLMPSDIGIKSIGDGSARTDTYVQVGSKKVPVYLPYVKDEAGQTYVTFGGKKYTGNTTSLTADDNSDVILSNREAIPYDGDSFSRGKVYRAYNGKANIDGSPKEDYYFVGYDNKMYKFDKDDPQGKALIEGMKVAGGLNTSSIPRINPFTASQVGSVPLPKDNGGFHDIGQTTQRGMKIDRLGAEAQALDAEATRLESQGPAAQVFEGIKGFFSRKNRAAAPVAPVARTGNDVIDQGASFFKKRQETSFTPQ